jgi:hypothetical protein
LRRIWKRWVHGSTVPAERMRRFDADYPTQMSGWMRRMKRLWIVRRPKRTRRSELEMGGSGEQVRV